MRALLQNARLALFAALFLAFGQPSPAQLRAVPPPQDPLMQLMLSQPRIDIESVVVPVAVFEPPVIRPGGQATYRVMFNALEASISWPGDLPAPPGLSLRPGGRGQVFTMTGTNMQPRTTFLFRAKPQGGGVFTVPEFTVTVYGRPVRVPAAQLEVASAPEIEVTTAPILRLELPQTNLYLGQTIRPRVILPAIIGGNVQLLAQVQINGEGFLADSSAASQRVESRNIDGTNQTTVVYETTLTPIAAGKLKAFAQGYTVGNRLFGVGSVVITGPAVIQGGPPQYTLLDSDPVEVSVLPLPAAGRLAGFTGAVGVYKVEAPALSTNRLRVGEPLKLAVKVRGTGSLARLVAPAGPRLPDWQVFAAEDSTPAPIVQAQGFATFNYTLIPMTDEARATPPIPFCAFDPVRGVYADLTIPAVPVTVNPAAAPGDLAALLRAESNSPSASEVEMLTGLTPTTGRVARSLVPVQQQAWFPAVQLAPAAVFAGLWGWDRRRRYLEQHPEVIRCRQARRALRRHRRALDQAARAGDTPGFAAAAVAALRAVCAPHYPAEPRALVGADVLPLLSESDRAGRPGEVVRRCFAIADACQYATETVAAGELPGLHPELERVLANLESQLAA